MEYDEDRVDMVLALLFLTTFEESPYGVRAWKNPLQRARLTCLVVLNSPFRCWFDESVMSSRLAQSRCGQSHNGCAQAYPFWQ
jgi:hypothetical protein